MTLLSSLLLSVALAATPEPLNDAWISEAIEGELAIQTGVPSFGLSAHTVDGVTTLSGTVDDALSKRRAAEIAMSVKGVRAVVNRIEVVPVSRDDAAIALDIETALAFHPVTESWDVTPKVRRGVVTLKGEVSSWSERQVAERVALGIPGVAEVKNKLLLNSWQPRDAQEIQAEVEDALRWDVRIDDGLVQVEVKEDKVILSGIVGSLAEVERARVNAWVAGVNAVDTEALEIRWWADDAQLRADKYVDVTDAAARDAVLDALRRDPRVDDDMIEVVLIEGRASLKGEVTSLLAWKAAEQDARNTVGVTAVRNRLRVAPQVDISDDELDRYITDSIVGGPLAKPGELNVTVLDGAVTLTGVVDSPYEKAQAGYIAGRVAGVTALRNHLIVQQPAYPELYWPHPFVPGAFAATPRPDIELQGEIEDQLFWSPFVDAPQVQVQVRGGEATLTGTVDTFFERRVAEENAWEGGALAVDNDLLVAPPPQLSPVMTPITPPQL